MNENYITTFEEWERRITRAVDAHYSTSLKLQKNHKCLGITALVLVALLGFSKELQELGIPDNFCSVITRVLTLVVAILVSLQTFLKYGERAEKHKEVASSFGALRRRIELIAKKTYNNKESLEEELLNLGTEWDNLSKIAPASDADIWKEVKIKYNSQTFKSKINPK